MGGLSVTTLMTIVVQLLKIINWANGQISQQQWKDLGRQELLNEQVIILLAHTNDAEKNYNLAKQASDEELAKELQS